MRPELDAGHLAAPPTAPRRRAGRSALHNLSLFQRLTLVLLLALLFVLIPLGFLTIRETRRTTLASLQTSVLSRLGYYGATSPGDLSALAGLANEYGGYGFLARRSATAYTDTAAHILPPAVSQALQQQRTYTALHGDELFVVSPFDVETDAGQVSVGAAGLAVRAADLSSLTRRLIFIYSGAAGGLFLLVGFFGNRALRYALTPLSRWSAELADRSPDNLAPLPLPNIPELLPTAERLNQLLSELAYALTRLEQQEQAARRFAGQASHELRTPLTALGSYLEVLERRPDEPRAVAGALREMARMRSLLEALLTLARLEGRAQAELGPVELTAFVRARFPQLELRAAAPLQLRVEAELLSVVLTNLLSNAQHYGTPPVILSARELNGAGRLELCDSGPGFSAAMLAHGLEPFVHDGPQGSGLGLAIVRAAVAVLGGRVALENCDSGGACVYLDFSLASGDTR